MTRDAAIVKIVREMKGLTQMELGDRVGVREATIRRLERGEQNIKLTTWAKIAEVLTLKFDWASRAVQPPSNVTQAAIDAMLKERMNGASHIPSPDRHVDKNDPQSALAAMEAIANAGKISPDDVIEHFRKIAATAGQSAPVACGERVE